VPEGGEELLPATGSGLFTAEPDAPEPAVEPEATDTEDPAGPQEPAPVPVTTEVGLSGPRLPAPAPLPASGDPALPNVPDAPPAPLPTSGGAGPEAGESGEPSGAVVPVLRAVRWVPVGPAHRSTEAERDSVRAYLAERWDHHSGAVSRALTRVPALRSSTHPEEAAADLAALHAYMTSTGGESHRALRESLDAGSTELVAFLGCLASGLRRLPSYRGAVVRSAGGVLREAAELLLPGEELGEAVPVSGVALDKGYPSVPADHYLIWSMTGRRASSLLGDSESGAAAGAPASPADEVLFAPGTRLRVLAVDDRAGATLVLLRELHESAPPNATPGQLDDADSAVLKRLYALKDQPTAVGSGQNWPERCAGALGSASP
jgi:hypothetical protein